MAKSESKGGQLVSVTTETETGKPLHRTVVVAEPDPRKAELIVRGVVDHDEKVTAVARITASVIEWFGLAPGEYTQWT